MPKSSSPIVLQRSQQRDALSLRSVEIIRGFTENAPGSVLISYGKTKVLCTATLEDRVPRHIYGQGTHGWLTAEYSLLPGSTNTRAQRDRYKVSGRTMEIQRLIGRTLRTSVDLPHLGQRTIHLDADVLQADGGTRVAAITGCYVALMDALHQIQDDEMRLNPAMKLWPLPHISPVAAVSVGVVNGQVLLDLDYNEDSTAEVDANIVMNAEGQFIEVQASSEAAPFDRDTMNRMMDAAEKGIRELLDLQQQALKSPKGQSIVLQVSNI
jgi:ribonuclease PH